MSGERMGWDGHMVWSLWVLEVFCWSIKGPKEFDS